MLVFEKRGKPEYAEKNLSEQGENQQQTHPYMTPGPGIERAPHWWEASALTTASPLLQIHKSSNCHESLLEVGSNSPYFLLI